MSQNAGPPAGGHRRPSSPTDLGSDSWTGVARRAAARFKAEHGLDYAASLTFFGVLAIFPAALALTSLVGLVGNPQRTTDALLGVVDTLGPGSATETFAGPIRDLAEQRSAAGFALVLGLASALWSASGYVSAFGRASNVVFETTEGRPFYKLKPFQILVTLAAIVLVALVAFALILTGPLAEAAGEAVGLGSAAVTAWEVAKWPALVVVVGLVFALLYYASPNVEQPKFRWMTLGGTVAIVLWAAASAAFGLYVANFGSYNKTYGSLAAVVVFLMWLWISNIALLLGAYVNAEVERAREMQAGVPGAEDSIQLPERSTETLDTDQQAAAARR